MKVRWEYHVRWFNRPLVVLFRDCLVVCCSAGALYFFLVSIGVAGEYTRDMGPSMCASYAPDADKKRPWVRWTDEAHCNKLHTLSRGLIDRSGWRCEEITTIEVAHKLPWSKSLKVTCSYGDYIYYVIDKGNGWALYVRKY